MNPNDLLLFILFCWHKERTSARTRGTPSSTDRIKTFLSRIAPGLHSRWKFSRSSSSSAGVTSTAAATEEEDDDDDGGEEEEKGSQWMPQAGSVRGRVQAAGTHVSARRPRTGCPWTTCRPWHHCGRVGQADKTGHLPRPGAAAAAAAAAARRRVAGRLGGPAGRVCAAGGAGRRGSRSRQRLADTIGGLVRFAGHRTWRTKKKKKKKTERKKRKKKKKKKDRCRAAGHRILAAQTSGSYFLCCTFPVFFFYFLFYFFQLKFSTLFFSPA